MVDMDESNPRTHADPVDVEPPGPLAAPDEESDVEPAGERQPVEQFIGDASDAVVAIIQDPSFDPESEPAANCR